jgi:hypothetical protein
VIIIDMRAFHTSRAEAEAAARRIFLPFAQPAEEAGPHSHEYAIVLLSKETGDGDELLAFESVCPEFNAAGSVRAIVAALREAADQFEAGHADILAEDDDYAAGKNVPSATLVDLLSLVQVTVTEADVLEWTQAQRDQAAHWATAVHLYASDNDVEVPEQPDFLAVGDFRVGDLVRNRQNGTELTVTGGGIWLNSFYELVRCNEVHGYHAPGCDCNEPTGD